MNYKKGISLGLALSLVLGTNVSALSTTDDLITLMKDRNLSVNSLQNQISEEAALQSLKKTDEVRIIVEMEENAVIEAATGKGIKLEEMDKSEFNRLQTSAEATQEKVQDKMTSNGISFKKINSFTNVINGFSATTTLASAEKMEGIAGVKSVTIVNEYERPTPQMNSSNEITEAVKTWANGYEGEGMVISIIDTGIDSSHRDMRLDDKYKAELEKSEVDAIVKDKNLPGMFFTDKVPYGYNYMDGNKEIRDLGPDASMHGMHVAGIAAANGDIANGGIKGTAPEAQLLAMKVFGNNPAMPSTFGDVIIKALDDSVALGADVINMSLGSTAGFVDDTDPEQAAVNRAVDNGVLVSISAGNSNAFGNGASYPYLANPDYGVSGAPGLATDSLQVASVENNITTGYGIEFKVGEVNHVYPYTTAGTDILSVLKGEKLKVVDCGIGKPEEIPAEVKGNVALIKRGDLAFTDKITNAAKAGAKAVIIYNNEANGDALINMQYPEGQTVPAIFMGNSGGALIKANAANADFTVSFNGGQAHAANPGAGQMSDFTSWGLTPDLEFKPEITGVGGNVWSTANDNGYQNMSGTSMAAPNVSGGAALVLEMLQNKYPELTGEAKTLRAKNILMSTALPNVDEYGYFTSPRRQGAGVMNLAAATSTPAIVTESTTGVTKVALKEIKGDSAVFKIKVQNLSDKEISYNVEGTVQTDYDYNGLNTLTPQSILNAVTKQMPISFSNSKITVPPKGSKEITVTVDLKNAILETGKTLEETFVNGGYVEGFVTLTDPTDTNPKLSIPYVGFKGEWDKAPTIDASIYDKEAKSFYGKTAMMSPIPNEPGNYNYLGLSFDATSLKEADGNFIDFSPNGDGQTDAITPMLSYLRNIKEMELQILDSKGNVIRTLDRKEELRKHYYDGNPKNPIREIIDDATWDGTVNGKVAPDGTYTYRVATKIDFEGAKWQYNDFKINLDTTAPKFDGYVIDEVAKTLTIKAQDNQNGHMFAYLLSTPISQGTPEKVIINSTGVFDISKEIAAGYGVKDFFAGLIDYAQNFTPVILGEPTGPAKGDKVAPVVNVTSPEFLGTLNNKSVVFTGTITDESSIESFTINGEKPQITYNLDKKAWEFSHTLTIEDGYHSIYFNAKDSAGNELGFAHKVFVDSTNPIIVANYVDSVTTADTVNISAKITDNFPNLKVSINGQLVKKTNNDLEYFDTLQPASYDLNYEYKLQPGVNNIVLEVEDDGGNIVTKQFTVEKVANMGITTKELIGVNRYETAIKVSNEGWTKAKYAVIANGTAYVDALVAAPLAALYDAPILLSDKETLTPGAGKELQRLGVQEVFIIGGTSVVSNNVATDIADLGIKVTRIGGANRYDTSLRVAKYIEREKAITNVYVVGGQAIPDAVTISPKAAEEVAPIMLVGKNSVDKDMLNWISDAKVTSAHVIGGTAVVNDSVVKKLGEINNKAVTVDRTAGDNRYATNAAVINNFYSKYEEKVMVTESKILVDALVVAPYAAKYGAPVVITDNSLKTEQKSVMDKMIAKEVVKIGGKVSNEVIKDIAERLNK